MNDKRIISAITNRDEQMLSYVVRKYSKLLWKIAASILINSASAQDVEECVADVFIYLWQYPEKYDPDKAKLFSWLSMVARSRGVNRYQISIIIQAKGRAWKKRLCPYVTNDISYISFLTLHRL